MSARHRQLLCVAFLLSAGCAQPKPWHFEMASVIDKLGPVIAHRSVATECPQRAPRAYSPGQPHFVARSEADLGQRLYASDCAADEDCRARPNGHCTARLLKGHWFDRCAYDECYSDSDCANGGACECGTPEHVCVTANCRTDADCGAGRWCSPSDGCDHQLLGYFCRTLSDECVDSSMCTATPLPLCAFDGRSRRWSCLRCDVRR